MFGWSGTFLSTSPRPSWYACWPRCTTRTTCLHSDAFRPSWPSNTRSLTGWRPIRWTQNAADCRSCARTTPTLSTSLCCQVKVFSIYSVSHDWGRIKAYFFMVYLMVNELWVQLCLPPFFATCPFGSLEVVGPLKWPFSALEIKMLVRSSVTIYPLRFSDVQSSKFIFNMRSTLLWTFWETVHQIILHLFHQVALSFLGLTSMSVLSAWPRFESPTSRFLKVSWIFWRELIWVVFAKKKLTAC